MFIGLFFCILRYPKAALYYAFTGLDLWYKKLIPSLLPFMILSGMMIRMQLTGGFVRWFKPVLGPLLGLSKNGIYATIIGFLCGFPMGARTIAELMENRMLSRKEGEYLLAFINNIGPAYFCGFVLPLLQIDRPFPYLFGMYGLPFFYGVMLRHTFYRNVNFPEYEKSEEKPMMNVLQALDESIRAGLIGIAGLGGYMILFNLFLLPIRLLFGQMAAYLAPIFEISGGLAGLKNRLPFYSLICLPFGGFSCIAQTYGCICKTGLSLQRYTFHKIVLTLLTALYYMFLFGLSS